MQNQNIYLDRYAYPDQYLDYQPFADTGIIIVLPCHNEPDLISSLNALNKCKSHCSVEIIVVINASENASTKIKQQNLKTYQEALVWSESAQTIYKSFHFILENELPKKHAGVGLARKIGMDEAVRMFESIDNQEGVILCFDADCNCKSNLLLEVFNFFKNNPESPGCSINFEHPLDGSLDKQVYRAITYYELHLRYYVDALKYAGFPYAYHTIGSSMAVRSSAYQKQGGMNRRKAGEDFYFLHKVIPLGNFGEVNSTTIYPSPRASDRVPFGTGRAVGEWLSGAQDEYKTYHHQIFEDLKVFINQIDSYFDLDSDSLQGHIIGLPKSVLDYLVSLDFDTKLREIKSQSTNLHTFRKRFFQWFDGFRVLKYVHFARDNFYPNIPTTVAIDWLFENNGEAAPKDLKEKLIELRKLDTKGTR